MTRGNFAMKLQPLYNLRERLKQTAIAGTGLLGEDFRLSQAAEDLKPLAAASPIFAKILSSLDRLLSAPAQDRGGLLLDLLALVDAVIYTQGSTGAEGELCALPVSGGTYQQISYGQLQPLAAALTTSGGGRMETVQSAWETHPEYFSDYRILPLVVQDLGDKFTDLASLNAKILVSLGRPAIPLLKASFDPSGKAAMVRRVEVIEKIAGASENEFYLEQLPKAKRDVQLALIWALRHSSANGPKLLELCQTKKGDAQDMAYQALVRSNSPESQKHFESMASTDPDQTLKRLEGVNTDWSGPLTARLFQAELDKIQADPQMPLTKAVQSRFTNLLRTLPHKLGTEIWALYRRAAALGEFLERDAASVQFNLNFGLSYGPSLLPFRRALDRSLAGTLACYQAPEAWALALDLCRKYGNIFLCSSLVAQLRTLDSASCYA